MKILTALLAISFSGLCFSDESKSNKLCVKDNLTYSLGSVVKEKDGKVYLCVRVFKENMLGDIAWVEIDSENNLKNNYTKNNK